MLGIQRAYVRVHTTVSGHPEEGSMHASLDYSPSRQIETAQLEAERKKANGITGNERQRMRMF